jgi:VIT1/CCC1 family predicted Fe2+/Mn2+ transporter
MEDVLERWRSEKTSSFLSDAVAANEPDPKRAKLFGKMAEAAEAQAAIIAKDLKQVPEFKPSARTRITVFLLGILPPRAMRNVLSAHKVRGISVYRCKMPEPEVKQEPQKSAAGDSSHPWPTSVDDIGRQHRNYTSGTLRAGVFGVNDGLVSNTCLIMAVAGAGVGPSEILLTGIAGLLAGAFSMGAGEFISMLSQREMFEHQIAQEKDELERYPDQEAEELALIYEARGIPFDEARDMAKHLIANPEKALDALTRGELGLNPEELGSPIGAALSSFLTFSVGACVPLVPYLMGYEKEGTVIAAVLAGIALFGVGSALSLFSGKDAMLGGGRMLVVGSIAAAATYFIGSLLGASVS